VIQAIFPRDPSKHINLMSICLSETSYTFVGEESADNGEGITTIGARVEILRREEVGQTFLDVTRREPSIRTLMCSVFAREWV
jgi:hypothetical protein